MKLLATRFFTAISRSSARATASLAAGGRRMSADRAIDAGTIASTRARRDTAPIVSSIDVSAAATMPMWRAKNSSAFSSWTSGCTDMGMRFPLRRSGVLDELVVGGLVEQRVGLGRVGDLHLEEPA